MGGGGGGGGELSADVSLRPSITDHYIARRRSVCFAFSVPTGSGAGPRLRPAGLCITQLGFVPATHR